MKILVCGSRGWDNDEAIYNELRKFPAYSTVIHGAAPGADQAAGIIAAELKMYVQEVPAEWDRYGRGAGIIRNKKMLDLNPDIVLAFWDGESRGTRHTIKESLRRGIPTHIIGGKKDG